ncbi:uncharacterized protein METZ01_LOCUS491307 [marine metagenome]|uniref:Uncharacterized protein n=1 Tax=marine metagenome TaxID=408172 RepID=A0A383D2H5_9ZZZZ
MDVSEIPYLIITYTLIGFGFACGFELFRRIRDRKNKGRNSYSHQQKWQ